MLIIFKVFTTTMDWKEVAFTAWGAVQASISVLLIMVYGYGARSLKLLNKQSTKITTTLFLPALIFSEIGPEATLSKLMEYWPIIIFSLFNLLFSYLFASLGHQIFKSVFPFPRWIIPCCMYNNVITLTLLMIETLGSTGALDGIIGDPTAIPDALRRAKIYCLINALVYNLTKFSIAPKMMSSSFKSDEQPFSEESALRSASSYRPEFPERLASERTPLISNTSQEGRGSLVGQSMWEQAKKLLNPPLLAAVVAIFVGIIPALHQMFLNKDGAFTGSLTQSIQRLGNVYTAVQILVVGSQLYAGSERSTTKKLPKFAMIYLLTFRFVLMPAFSILLISSIRRWQPDLFLKDPMLDFALMIAPIGPPGVSIAAVAEIANLSDEDNAIIARMLTVSYLVTPLISLPIAAALTLVKNQAPFYAPL
ncbi:hypothetical protein K439DRAFT_59872 [Ramaria rubella]|nr:hypothetical protein K439DRAFT_59872 [Ramaria rubella]